jgi:hypothetical protein
MKTLKITTVLIMLYSSYCFSQFTFSVKPGLNFTGADFGFTIKKLEPYAGLKFANVKYTYQEDKLAVHVYLPHVGIKLCVLQKDNLKSYLNVALIKPVISGKSFTNGVEDTSFKDELKKIGLWGCEAGFASEYFLNEHFSIGGEFGLRYASLNYTDTNMSSVTEKLNLNMSYVTGSLNFYF